MTDQLNRMRRVGELITGKPHYTNREILFVFSYVNGLNDSDGVQAFSPSLAGEDWQQAQALQVIVAAFNMPGNLSMYKMVTVKGTYFQIIHNSDPGRLHDDLLETAISALLKE
jgi:hypothetical protein